MEFVLGDCTVCLENTHEDDCVTPNTCEDKFHQSCLEEWLNTDDGKSAKCPTCSTVFTKVVKSSKDNSCKDLLDPKSGTFDYMYLQRQYGAILCSSDESDTEVPVMSIDLDTDSETKKTFAEDLKKLCREKIHPLNEESHIRLKVRRNSV